MKSIEPHAAFVDEERSNASPSKVKNTRTVVAAESRAGSTTQHPQPLPLASNLKYLLHSARTSLPLLLGDQLALFSAVAVAAWGIYLFGASGEISAAALGLSLGCGLLVAFIVGDLYPGVGLPAAVEVRQCIVSTSLVFIVFLLAAWLYRPSRELVIVLLTAWFICLLLIPLFRHVSRGVFCRFGWWMQPVVILGQGNEGRSLFEALVSNPRLGLSPVGILDDLHGHWSGNGADAAEYLGPLEAAADISRRHNVYRAFVAMPERPTSEVHKILESSSEWFPHLVVIPSIQALPLLWTKTWHVGGHSGFQLRSRILLPLPRLIKRVIDLTVVIAAGPLFALLMLVIAAAIKYSSPGPVFYTQERIGLGGRRFWVWKFRTMVADAESVLDNYLKRHPELHLEWQQDRKLKDDPRIIPWTGHFLRKYSLDELPQLWNVLRGEMSLVGPRPLPQYHLDEFDEEFRRYREKITPGITGLWQVACRSDGDPAMLIKWDRYYIRNWSFWLDLQILFRTVKVVLSGDGAY